MGRGGGLADWCLQPRRSLPLIKQIPITKWRIPSTKWQIPRTNYQMPDIEINWVLKSTRSLPSSLRRLRHPWPTVAHSWWSLGWKQVIEGILFDIVIAIFITMVTKVSLGLGIQGIHCQCHRHLNYLGHMMLQDCNCVILLERTGRRWHCLS